MCIFFHMRNRPVPAAAWLAGIGAGRRKSAKADMRDATADRGDLWTPRVVWAVGDFDAGCVGSKTKTSNQDVEFVHATREWPSISARSGLSISTPVT